MLTRSTPPILGPDRRPVPGSVARLERVPIGGVGQFVLLRGVDPTQPVLLVVPDGPGGAWIPVARRAHRELERAFLVATWDPRGSGLSYDRRAPSSELTIARLVDDAVELAGWLARRFERDRIVLAGHGFGSVVGLLAAARSPERFDAYLGVSQWVEAAESEQRALAWARAQAVSLGRRRWARTLERWASDPGGAVERFTGLDRALRALGGLVEEPRGLDLAVPHVAELAEYTLLDLARARAGRTYSLAALARAALAIDLPRQVSKLEVPTFFLAGRADRRVDPELAREYLRVLDAPQKGWAWVEGAAHFVPFEEPDGYAAALANFAHRARSDVEQPRWAIAG